MMICNEQLERTERGVAAEVATKVAYIMSRFPKITETFVLFEILAMERLGSTVEIYPLLRERPKVMHAEAEALVKRAHYQPFWSWPILKAQLYFLRRTPWLYLSTLVALLRGTWGSINFLLRDLALFPKIVYFALQMKRDGITHVHCHFATHPAAAGFIIRRLVGIPYSFTAHGSDLHCDRHMLREKVSEAAFVVAISNYNRELIVSECGEQYRSKTVVIHCGVDTEVFLPPSNRTSSLAHTDPFNILCLGTLHEVKGQIYLLDACALLAERGLNFDCGFIGDGPDERMLKLHSIRKGLKARVHFHGRKTRDEIAELVRNADVVVAPSVPTRDGRREGIPIVLMEAMASGLPVVASGISGIPELVEHDRTGLLVPPRDADALANALERLHSAPLLRKKMGKAGRKKVEQDFNLRVNAGVLRQCFPAAVNPNEHATTPRALSKAPAKAANKQPHAIIIGLDRITGLQTARILARHNVPIIAIADDPNHHFCRTKVCERILIANTASTDFITTLAKLGPELAERAVLFPCSDLSVLLISRHREQLQRWYHVVLPEHDVVEMLMDKVGFYTYARKAQLPIPRTYIVKSRAEVEEAATELKFPCILKPPLKTPAWDQHAGSKVFKVRDAESLLKLYERCSPWSESLMLQEWIEGTDADLYSCNCYFTADSRPLVTFISKKVRQWPPEIGVSSLGEECRNDVVLQESIRLFEGVSYRGLGYVEMKRDARTGEHFIIEPNIGRPTGRSAIAEAGGVDLLFAAYCDTVQRPLPANIVQQYGSAKWIYMGRDIQSALHYWRRGELTLRQWWHSWRGRKKDAVFSLTDLGPFWGDVRKSFKVIRRRNRRAAA